MIRIRAMHPGRFETPVTHGQLLEADEVTADLIAAIRIAKRMSYSEERMSIAMNVRVKAK